MAVLTNIPNNTSARDWRDTVNALIKRIAALEAAGVPVETPAPAFTTQPSISPTSGTAGSTVYAATPGTVSNGSVVSRAWLLNGVAISNGVTAVPSSSGTLTYQETASGPGGTTTSSVQVAAVTAATTTPTPAPAFTSQPSISPNSGTAGATTFTATAGNVSNGSVASRSWTINGTVISTGLTASPASSGTLTYQETATGSGGTTQSTVQQVTVATAAAPAPAFTTQPTVSPSTGTAGTTTYTATPGAVSNGTITSRAWALNGSVISTGLTAAPASAGTLTYQEFATGSGGSASSSILTRTVSAAQIAPLTVLFIGSSTPARYFTDNTGPANSQVTASSDGTTFSPIGTTGAGATNLGDQLQKATGRPIRFIKGGLGGTQAAEWDATNFAQRTAAINAAIAAGGVDLIICAVGFNDAYQADGVVTSQASHQATLASIYNRMRTGIGQPNVPIFIMGSQKYTGSATNKPNDMYTWIRTAEIALADAPDNYWYAHSYDLAQLSDGIHQAAASYITHASRGASNILRFLAGQSVERGPRISGVTAVYTTKTDVRLAHSTGSDFTPVSAVTGFELSFDNFATTVAISAAVRLSASVVRLTHAASGGAAPAVRVIYGAAPNTAASLHDNSPHALPINPTAVAIVANAGSTIVDPDTGTSTPTPSPSTFTDEFDYANGSTLAANGWTSPSGTFTVQDGEVYGSAIGNSIAPFIPGSATMGAIAPIRILSLAQGNTLIKLHYQDESNYIWAGAIGSNGKWQIGKTVNGVAGSIATDLGPAQVAGSTYVVDFSVKPNTDGTAMLATMVIDGVAIYTDVVIADAVLQPKGRMGLRQSSAASTSTTRARFTRFVGRSS
ncbi:hypothetical protein QTN93_03450 [Sphingomonas aerolata]|uniref:hypothetical protein n=1 Tax=Sphingomonas aerolata TaxID=185951 RepID=UPI0035A5761D